MTLALICEIDEMTEVTTNGIRIIFTTGNTGAPGPDIADIMFWKNSYYPVAANTKKYAFLIGREAGRLER